MHLKPLREIVLDTPAHECKGLTFRGRVNEYFDRSTGKIGVKWTLRLLKRKSCPGCEGCGWTFDQMDDMIASEGLVWPDAMEDGAEYEIMRITDPPDYETGAIDDWHFEIRRKR